ncbi:hypothetical protein ACWGRK_04555 [Saccharomonospora azurea]
MKRAKSAAVLAAFFSGVLFLLIGTPVAHADSGVRPAGDVGSLATCDPDWYINGSGTSTTFCKVAGRNVRMDTTYNGRFISKVRVQIQGEYGNEITLSRGAYFSSERPGNKPNPNVNATFTNGKKYCKPSLSVQCWMEYRPNVLVDFGGDVFFEGEVLFGGYGNGNTGEHLGILWNKTA